MIPRQPVKTDDNIGRGMDLALVTLVFLGIGYGLDRWFNTRPVFMICFVMLALVGQFVRMRYDYEQRMRAHEHQRSTVTQRSAVTLRDQERVA